MTQMLNTPANIEAVARALCRSSGRGHDHDWESYTTQATAAIRALLASSIPEPEAASSDEDAEWLRSIRKRPDWLNHRHAPDCDRFERIANRLSAEPEAVTLREALEQIQLLATNHGAWLENSPGKLVDDIHRIASASLTNVSSRVMK